jgi:hypothetical protein
MPLINDTHGELTADFRSRIHIHYSNSGIGNQPAKAVGTILEVLETEFQVLHVCFFFCALSDVDKFLFLQANNKGWKISQSIAMRAEKTRCQEEILPRER